MNRAKAVVKQHFATGRYYWHLRAANGSVLYTSPSLHDRIAAIDARAAHIDAVMRGKTVVQPEVAAWLWRWTLLTRQGHALYSQPGFTCARDAEKARDIHLRAARYAQYLEEL